MDIFRLLRREHAGLLDMLIGWIRRPEGAEGAEAWVRWCERWEVHARVEENFLFPLLRDDPDMRRSLAPVMEAHARIRKCVQAVPPYREESLTWAESAADLLESLESLMDLEEGGLFPKARVWLGREASEELASEVSDFLRGLQTALAAGS